MKKRIRSFLKERRYVVFEEFSRDVWKVEKEGDFYICKGNPWIYPIKQAEVENRFYLKYGGFEGLPKKKEYLEFSRLENEFTGKIGRAHV